MNDDPDAAGAVVDDPTFTLGAFLRARRSRVRPEHVGIAAELNRRVSGLRRAEVAELAGISADYYLRLEQGRGHQPSESVLRSLASALLLSEESLDYMRRLAHGVFPDPPQSEVDPMVLSLIESLDRVPAIVIDANQDILEANPIARALGAGALDPGENLVLRTFSDRRWRSTQRWHEIAQATTADLRAHASPHDRRLREIVGSLSLSDPDFPTMWAEQEVASQRGGLVRHHVDPIGWIDLAWQNLEVPGTGQRVMTFWAERGSRAAAALSYLAVAADLPAAVSARDAAS